MKLNDLKPRSYAVAAILLFSILSPLSAFADLQVFPLRIVLSEKARTAQVAVRHRGTQPMRYRISSVFYRMKPDGGMELVGEPKAEEKPASSYFTFSPRQVMLQPNVEQVVRVLMRAPADLAEGEYRAHLYFEGLDEGDEKNIPAGTASDGAQMFLKARMAVAIPIIVRKGEPSVKVSLANLKVVKTEDQKLNFAVEMSKEGNANVYGDIQVVHTAKGGKSTVVGNVNGVSSYIDKRTVSYPLAVESLGGGTLRLELKRPVADGGEVIATTETEIK